MFENLLIVVDARLKKQHCCILESVKACIDHACVMDLLVS